MRQLCIVAMLAALALGCASGAGARPQQKIVDACLRTESTPEVSYQPIPFQEIVDAEFDGETVTARFVRHGATSAGMRQSQKTRTFGLMYNCHKIAPRRITALRTQHRPEPFDVVLARYGTARAANQQYLCITFNFEGLGQSGSFQNVRGLYLIDTRARPLKAYYTGGDIRAPAGQAGAAVRPAASSPASAAGRLPAEPR